MQLFFTPTKYRSPTPIRVVLPLAVILLLQKTQLHDPLYDSILDQVIKLSQATGTNSPINSNPTSRRLNFETPFKIDSSVTRCFSLPFRSNNHSLFAADECSQELQESRSRQRHPPGNESAQYFENSLNDTVGTNPIVINGMDVNTLKPKECLNDSIINFWLKWLITPRSPDDAQTSIYAFSTHFLSGVLSNGYNESLQRWLKKVNIFQYQMLLFPVHLGFHWSIIAVLNPMLINQTKTRWNDESYTRNVTCMIRLDSLGCSTIHDGSQIAYALRSVLNTEWAKHCVTALDQETRPFSHRHNVCKLISPEGTCECCNSEYTNLFQTTHSHSPNPNTLFIIL